MFKKIYELLKSHFQVGPCSPELEAYYDYIKIKCNEYLENHPNTKLTHDEIRIMMIRENPLRK